MTILTAAKLEVVAIRPGWVRPNRHKNALAECGNYSSHFAILREIYWSSLQVLSLIRTILHWGWEKDRTTSARRPEGRGGHVTPHKREYAPLIPSGCPMLA